MSQLSEGILDDGDRTDVDAKAGRHTSWQHGHEFLNEALRMRIGATEDAAVEYARKTGGDVYHEEERDVREAVVD